MQLYFGLIRSCEVFKVLNKYVFYYLAVFSSVVK